MFRRFLLAIGLLFGFGLNLAQAQVTFDADAAAVNTGSAASFTSTNQTVGVGSNRALLVTIVFASAKTPTCNWDTTGTPQALTNIIGAGTVNQIWGLINPTSGNKTLVCSWTGSVASTMNSSSFAGVDQTGGATSFPNSVTNSASGFAPTVTITVPANGLAIDSVFAQNASLSAPTQTQLHLSTSTGSAHSGSSRSTASGSIVFGWTSGSVTWTDNGTAIAAAAGVVAKPSLSLMGVGQ